MLKMLLDASGGAWAPARVRRKPADTARLVAFSHGCWPHSKGIVLTNDGNAILREIDVSHPAAKARAA